MLFFREMCRSLTGVSGDPVVDGEGGEAQCRRRVPTEKEYAMPKRLRSWVGLNKERISAVSCSA